MGIKDVWNILQPYCERKPLYELQNKRVAIDLSGWVCQAQCVTDYQIQPKMYLRNLYFRTCYLLLQDVQVVFVLEGAAPALKHKTMKARNEMQVFKGAKPKQKKTESTQSTSKEFKGRSRFNSILKQCQEMLKFMGLACVTGHGEAEAMCAYLNKEGLVQGCISQDSDCFAYGAQIVYRNFSIAVKGNTGSSGGSIDIYDLRKAESEIDFGRNKIIAMALLCGSDYNDGVQGIGKENALKLFSKISEHDILKTMQSWRTNELHYEGLSREYNDKNRCTTCGHFGKKAVHTRKGCSTCRTFKSCNPNEDFLQIKHELALREKALANDDFPDEELLEEFLNCNESLASLDVDWKMPSIDEFISFTCKHLQWEEIYAFEKIFPILCRWLVFNPRSHQALTIPEHIKKRRAPKGISSYEIVWNSDKLVPLIPQEQLDLLDDVVKLFTTIEPAYMVDKNFPELVQRYEESKAKPVKKRKKEKKPETPKVLKKFIKKKVLTKSNAEDSLLGDDDDDADLSLIIDEIVSRGVPKIFQKKINDILDSDEQENLNEASFFHICADEEAEDLFEKSIAVYNISSSSESEEEFE